MITIKKHINSKKISNKDLVLDIETTGLDFKSDKLVLLGLVKVIDNKTYIFQYFAEDDSEEERLLDIYLREIEGKRAISFNGEIFDFEFLNSRLIDHEKFPVIIDNSLDIYRIIKRSSKFIYFDSMKLVDIEKLIGINRNDPSRYKAISKLTDYLRKRDKPYPILKHNENDLIATTELADIKDILKNKLSISTKLGNIYIFSANINKDIANIEFRVEDVLKETYLVKDNYQIIIKNNLIKINLFVLYGNFPDGTSGHVAINTLKIKNNADTDINENLLIIRHNSIYNYKNLLALAQKIIETIDIL
ncbi:ribonuclease H-like domain-containing protein [uncultured Anaerococcus sp.]|uniref:ribonuclease H-like domain-containing protein n=1 Tax=uncultured Anaerococcus sp. TaxID=293428 RepID=UPI002639CE24|nr:ribonuclease H-like domain-containing protein [uncultured Anaerococcus sp.]